MLLLNLDTLYPLLKRLFSMLNLVHTAAVLLLQLYEVLCERMVISTRASRFASFLAITTQNLRLDDS